jgi:hypothetical protein
MLFLGGLFQREKAGGMPCTEHRPVAFGGLPDDFEEGGARTMGVNIAFNCLTFGGKSEHRLALTVVTGVRAQ